MPWCSTCGEKELPIDENGVLRWHHKNLTWKEYFEHKFSKKYQGHESYL